SLTAPQVLLELGTLLVGHRAQRELDAGDAVHLAERATYVAVDGVLERTAGDGEQHGDRDLPRVVDREVVDHAELGDRPLELGVVDGGQGSGQPLDGGRAHDGSRVVRGVISFLSGTAT